jgi:hypothetical protein
MMTPDILQRAGPAATLAAKVNLSDEARALLRPEWPSRPYLEALVAAGHLVDAIRFLAWALPRREAVWWACQCIRAANPTVAASGSLAGSQPTTGPVVATEDAAALVAAEKWSSSATEDHRRAAFAAAEAAKFETPAALAALAAFWSGGSLAPPKLPVVPPAEKLCPEAIGNAVILAGVLHEPEKADEKYRAFLQLGQDVAAGGNRWKEERPAAPAGRR